MALGSIFFFSIVGQMTHPESLKSLNICLVSFVLVGLTGGVQNVTFMSFLIPQFYLKANFNRPVEKRLKVACLLII